MRGWFGRVGAVAAWLAATSALGACGDDTSDSAGSTGEGFGPPAIVPAPGGMRRLTSTQLRYSIEYLLGTDAAALFDVWDDPTLHDFESIAATELALGASEVSTLEGVVRTAV